VIYAKLDVCFYRHTRFLRAGLEASAIWAATLTFLRENDSKDGRIEYDELWRLFAVGEERGRKLADRLIEVGLFEACYGGYILLRYAAKNETREEIEARRADTRERVAKHRRETRKAANSGTIHGVTRNIVTGPTQAVLPPTVTAVLVPGSDSHSGSVSSFGGEGGLVETTTPLPDDLRAAAAMLGVQDVDTAWRTFTGHYNGQQVGALAGGLAGAWQKWCAREAKGERTTRDRVAQRGPAQLQPAAPARIWKVGDGQ
jgi:hypothetical protein